jgi:hypothetical protein
MYQSVLGILTRKGQREGAFRLAPGLRRCAAPFQGWRVAKSPAAEGGTKTGALERRTAWGENIAK